MAQYSASVGGNKKYFDNNKVVISFQDAKCHRKS
jgi:hypothetical protein